MSASRRSDIQAELVAADSRLEDALFRAYGSAARIRRTDKDKSRWPKAVKRAYAEFEDLQRRLKDGGQ